MPAAPALAPAAADSERLKREVRKVIRARRNLREVAALAQEDAALAQAVLPLLERVNTIAAFVSINMEPPTRTLLEVAIKNGKRVLVPALGTDFDLAWAQYRSAQDLRRRQPGCPPEPSGPQLPPEALTEADLVLLPALAVDRTGTRLGQGGGWYDRVLGHARPDAALIAVVRNNEVLAPGALPRQDHDIPVTAALTPKGIICFDDDDVCPQVENRLP